MENKESEEERREGTRLVRKFFLSCASCSRQVFPRVLGTLDDKRHGVMVLMAIRRLRRYLFTYLSTKNFMRFAACVLP